MVSWWDEFGPWPDLGVVVVGLLGLLVVLRVTARRQRK